MSVQARELAGTFAPYCRNKFGMREDAWYIDPACKALRKELELYGIDALNADNLDYVLSLYAEYYEKQQVTAAEGE